jgi:hypothetical protein
MRDWYENPYAQFEAIFADCVKLKPKPPPTDIVFKPVPDKGEWVPTGKPVALNQHIAFPVHEQFDRSHFDRTKFERPPVNVPDYNDLSEIDDDEIFATLLDS